jgi:hypothetical protein
MRASAIVMANPLTKDSSQMRCVEWDDIVQTFATDGSNQAFTMSVGGRHANGRFQDVDAPAPNLTIQTSGESLVPIMKNKLAVLIAWKRFPQLLKCPFGRGMFGYVEVYETSGSDLECDEYIDDTELAVMEMKKSQATISCA